MANDVEEIKSKLDIVELISEYVQLKASGANFRGLCPFHNEKTPSFFVSPERQIWHCFGCSKGGDIFGFIQEIEGVDFPEALRILAEKAGVQIKSYDSHNISQHTKLLDICSLSAKFYHKVLLESPLAENARKYLKIRGIKKETINEFQLGFVPDKWDTFLKFSIKRGYKEEDIELAGLIIQKQRGSGYYDRFRNRLMFPINNTHGQVVGFTARVLPLKDKSSNKENEGERVAKYINTPETEIYNKSQILYGLDKAKLEAKLQNYFILVEGNMDVLSCHQAGNKNTVCTSGTALTIEQIKLLRRYTPNISLAFDIDSAGQTATKRGIDMLLNQGLNVRVIDLKGYKDPDEFIQKNSKEWIKVLEKPMPIMEYYFSLAFDKYRQNKKDLTIEAKKDITRVFLPVIARLGDSVEQGLWLRRLADELSISEVFLRDALKKTKVLKIYKTADTVKKNADSDKASLEQQAAERLLGLILKYPQQGIDFLKEQNLPLDIFPSIQTQNIAKFIRNYYRQQKKIDAQKIKSKIKERELANYYDLILFLIEKEFSEDSSLEIARDMFSFFFILKKKYLKSKIQDVLVTLREAEKNKDKRLVEKMSKEITKLSRDLID